MTSSRFDPGSTSVQPQKPWTSPFYGSLNGPGFKTLVDICCLSGTIPTQLCQLILINLMDLSCNFLSGTILHCFHQIAYSTASHVHFYDGGRSIDIMPYQYGIHQDISNTPFLEIDADNYDQYTIISFFWIFGDILFFMIIIINTLSSIL